MKKIILLFFVVGLISNISLSQDRWYKTNGPTGGPVFSVLEKSSSKIFIGTNSGIYKSVNSGSSFSPLSLNESQIIQITALNNRLFAIDGNYLLFRSLDDGSSWSNIASTQMSRLFVSNGILFGISPFSGIYKSTNYGDNWTLINGLPVEIDFQLASFGSYLYCYRSYVSNVIYRSSDNGDSWSVLNSDLPAFDGVNSFGSFNNFLFANLSTSLGSMIYKSTNSGVNWTKINNWDALDFVNSFVQSGAYILASVNQKGVYRSSNYGENWNLVNNGLSRLNSITLTKGSTKIYSSINEYFNSGALFQSSNSGTSWSELTNGLPTGNVIDMVLMNNNILAATSNGLYKSTNKGTNWSLSNTGLTSSNITVLARKDNTSTVYAGTYNSGLFVSNNFGTSWNQTDFDSDIGISSISILGENIYIGTRFDGVYASTDNGTSWTQTSLIDLRISALATKGKYVYAGWRNTHSRPHGGIYVSSDKGLTWTESDIPDAPVNSIGIFDNKYVIAASNAVYRSTNFGLNWNILDTGTVHTTPIVDPTDLVVMGYGDVYVANSNGVAGSYNYGKTWELVSYGLISTDCRVITGDMNLLLVGPYYLGVWKLPLSKNKSGLALLTDENNTSPKEYKLHQNYPNPFNPSTKIKFDIPESLEHKTLNAKLVVYDILGKVITTLVNEQLQPGTYEKEWEGTNYTSGIYFYKLTAGDYVETKKMLMIK